MNLGDFYKELSLVTDLGVQFLMPLVVSLIAGKFIVDKFNLPRIWLLLVILLGLIGGFYLVYKKMKKIFWN